MSGDELLVLDLFSGIGGFSLGLETISDNSLLRDRQICAKGSGETLAASSSDRRYSETERAVEAAATANVIVGGFPCQDLSNAGKRAGINGSRSGLWGEMRRTIGLVRPEWVIVENVSALLSGDSGAWFGRVLGDLAALGYDAEWHCIPASAVGAPHRRDRVWIIAYTSSVYGDDESKSKPKQSEKSSRWNSKNENGNLSIMVGRVSDRERKDWWRAQSRVARSVDEFPERMDRLRCIGNAVVPEVVRRIGRAILRAYQ